MKRVRDILLAVVAVMIVVACGESRHISDTHKQAEVVMQEHPDSALTLLQTINPDELTTDRGRAMHALLLSQAYDKNYIDLTDDSLITIAVDYFAPTNEHHYAMLAHYYHAVVNFNANELAISSISCLEAEKHALDLNNHQYLGMIYSLMMYIHNYSYNFDEELVCAQKSLEHFKKHGDEKYIGNALISLAGAYNNIKDYPCSEEIYLEAKQFANSIADTTLICRAIRGYAHVRKVQLDFDAVKRQLMTVLMGYNRAVNAVDYCHLSEAYIHENKMDSAILYLKKGEELSQFALDSVAVANARCSYCIAIGDHKNAMIWERQVSNHRYSTIQEIWQQAVVKSQRDYLNHKAEISAYKVEQFSLYLTIAIVSVAALLIAFVAFIQFSRHKSAKKQVRILQLESLNKDIQMRSEEELECIKKEIEKLSECNSEHISEIQKQREELMYYKNIVEHNIVLYQEKKLTLDKSETVKELKERAKLQQSLKGKDWADIDKLVNRHFEGFSQKLNNLTNLNRTEYQICLLLKCGLSPTEISTLINISKGGLGNARKRLYQKVFNNTGTAVDWDVFIQSIC
jgi:DNA-binding CsgD family transcriptional regulator